MPYYFITIKLSNGRHIKGIKDDPETRIDFVFRKYKEEAERHYRGSLLQRFDCYQISRQGPLYKEYMERKKYK